MPRMKDMMAASLGLIASVIFLILYVVAVSRDPGYTFFENYLSDLGVGPGAWAFNSAVILAGALTALFSVFGIRPVLGRGWRSSLGTVLLAVAGGFLVCVGIFTEDSGDIHYFVSVSFFFSLLLAAGVYTNALYRTRALGRFGVVVTLVTFLFGIVLISGGGSPESETLAVMTAVAWGVMISSACILRQLGKSIP